MLHMANRIIMIALIGLVPAACRNLRNTGAKLGFVQSERNVIDDLCRNSSKVSRMSVIRLSNGGSLTAIDGNPCGKTSSRSGVAKYNSVSGGTANASPSVSQKPYDLGVEEVNYPANNFGYAASAADRKKPNFIFAPSETSDPAIVRADLQTMYEAQRQGFRVIDMSALSSQGIQDQLTMLRRAEPGIFSDNRSLVYMSAHGQVREENGRIRHFSTIQGEEYVAETGQIREYDGFVDTADRIKAINRGLGQEFFNKDRSVIFNSSCFAGQAGEDLVANYSGPTVINAATRNQLSGSGEVFELMRMMDPEYVGQKIGSGDGSVTPQQFADYLNRPENQLGTTTDILVQTQYFTDFNDDFARRYNARTGIASDVTDDSYVQSAGGSTGAPIRERVTVATPQTIEIVGDGKSGFLIPPGRLTQGENADIPSASTFDTLSQGNQVEQTTPYSGSADDPYVVDED